MDASKYIAELHFEKMRLACMGGAYIFPHGINNYPGKRDCCGLKW
jgi:hypothetical protein